MIKILHIVQRITSGGGVTGLLSVGKYLAQLNPYKQSLLSLLPADPAALELCENTELKIIDAPTREQICAEIEKADIVQINFWNTPELFEFIRSDLPAMRLVIRFNINGAHPPQIILPELIDFADFAVASSPFSYESEVFQKLPPGKKFKKTTMIYGAADITRFSGLHPRPHDSFNVGYIGMVDYIKMHPRYVHMSSSIDIPNIHFPVVGHGRAHSDIKKEAERLNTAERFSFLGYQKDIRPLLETMDVLGYPLCPDNYSTSERILQEAMSAGIPSVIFNHGGAQRTIQHNYTGYIVNSEQEYKQAIEYLYHHPKERKRLGRNARAYAASILGEENAAHATHLLYERLLDQPPQKRTWHSPPINDPCSVESKDRKKRDERPKAEFFIETLGNKAPQFVVSMRSHDINAIIEAEKKIASSSPMLCSPGGGGILHYRSYYPDDKFLRLWAGLILEQRQDYGAAAAEYEKAISLGLDHERVYQYLTNIKKKLSDSATKKTDNQALPS